MRPTFTDNATARQAKVRKEQRWGAAGGNQGLTFQLSYTQCTICNLHVLLGCTFDPCTRTEGRVCLSRGKQSPGDMVCAWTKDILPPEPHPGRGHGPGPLFPGRLRLPSWESWLWLHNWLIAAARRPRSLGDRVVSVLSDVSQPLVSPVCRRKPEHRPVRHLSFLNTNILTFSFWWLCFPNQQKEKTMSHTQLFPLINLSDCWIFSKVLLN